MSTRRSPLLYGAVLRVLALFDAERIHHITFFLLRTAYAIPGIGALIRFICRVPRELGPVRALGLMFPSPLGLAAGFDKNAIGYDALGALGFGFVEIGTVTPRPQLGNPRPRVFRILPDGALLNRMGFNNDGAQVVASRLARKRRTIVGVNIGKNKSTPEDEAVADYIDATERLAPHADYLVVNVSSPNTPGLRALQNVEALRPILEGVRDALGRLELAVPLLVKVAPDLANEDVDAIADLAVELGIAGIVATNTTIGRHGLSPPVEQINALGNGGVSGAPLRDRALEVLERLARRAGDRLTLIASGGVMTPEDVAERLARGATLVQGYTGFVYGGPLWAARVGKALARARATSSAGIAGDPATR